MSRVSSSSVCYNYEMCFPIFPMTEIYFYIFPKSLSFQKAKFMKAVLPESHNYRANNVLNDKIGFQATGLRRCFVYVNLPP